MKTINVLVRDKIATAVGDIVYICGNSDYVVSFDFDEEWAVYDIKTARFVHNGTYTDVVFTGNQCAMPVIHKAYGIYVGVYAGDLRTTTPAHIPSAASILSAEGTPDEPPDDVYAQITALCNEAVSDAKSVRDDADAGKFNGAPGKTPEVGVDYFTGADKQAIAAEAAKEVGFPRPKVSDNGKYLGCENGAATWLPVDAAGGGATEEKWEFINYIKLTEDVGLVSFDTDSDGNPFLLKGVAVAIFSVAASTNTTEGWLKVKLNNILCMDNSSGIRIHGKPSRGCIFVNDEITKNVKTKKPLMYGNDSYIPIKDGKINNNTDMRVFSQLKGEVYSAELHNGVTKIDVTSGVPETQLLGIDSEILIWGIRM